MQRQEKGRKKIFEQPDSGCRGLGREQVWRERARALPAPPLVQQLYGLVKYQVMPPKAASTAAITTSIVETLLFGARESNIR